jgi:hypothetical protein
MKRPRLISRPRALALLVTAVAVAAGAACSVGAPAEPGSPSTHIGSTGGGGGSGGGGGGGSGGSSGYMPPVTPFAPDSPYTYVAKVKNILVGLPPLDSEVTAVAADPNATTTAPVLKNLISQWMQLVDPNNAEGLTYYQEKMIVFFKLAFQQTQVASSDFAAQFDQGQLQPMSNSSLLENAEESFARTALALPSFQSTMNTQSFMMTTALKVLYALTDVWQLDDTTNGVNDSFAAANKSLTIYVTGKTNIPLKETLDPTNKTNYMHWYVPGLSCTTDPVSFKAKASDLYDVITGNFTTKDFPDCTFTGTPLLAPSAYSDWTMVTVSAPTEGQQTTPFYDLENLPTATTLVLNRPYVSFFTTPVFFANWQTNASNEMRVTTNQSLIVALGQMIMNTDTTKVPMNPPGLDGTHAVGECVGCHQFLDPTRSVLAKQFSWNYGSGLQNATIDGDDFATQSGLFAFQGVVAYPKTVLDFGNTLANHPLFPAAWVQKLSYYVNSQANDPTDPVFQGIVNDFKSDFSWTNLVQNLMSSPLTTNAASTKTTAGEGVVVAVARRDHLCAAINFRLGFDDICNLQASNKPGKSPYLRTIATIAGGLPSDGYGRGAIVPVLPNQPTLFYRAGTENICESIAQLVIDPNAKTKALLPPSVLSWSSSDPTTAIQDFVTQLMGYTASHPLYKTAIDTLTAHNTAALALTGVTPPITATQALQSTFIAACLSPTFVGIGM